MSRAVDPVRALCLACAFAALLVFAPIPCSASEGPAREGSVPPADWYHIIKIDAGSYAISEPKYWQENVSYLLLGSRRALLFDTGPGIYSIREVVEKLTSLPVEVIPSHLHFDHVGRIGEFSNVGLLDTPELRAQVRAGNFTETPSQYLLDREYSFHVQRWIKDGEVIDLGQRLITVINTPGHTPESLSLIDTSNRRVFIGDLVNRAVVLLDVPGSSLRQALESLHRLLRMAPPESDAYEAHSEKVLTAAELRLIARGMDGIIGGRLKGKSVCLAGAPTLRYDVGVFPIMLPGPGDARLRPLKSATQSLDLVKGEACAAGT